jgi:hypothetical protein
MSKGMGKKAMDIISELRKLTAHINRPDFKNMKRNDILTLPLSDSGLSAGLVEAFGKDGVKTMKDLVSHTREELLIYRKLSDKFMGEIDDLLKSSRQKLREPGTALCQMSEFKILSSRQEILR